MIDSRPPVPDFRSSSAANGWVQNRRGFRLLIQDFELESVSVCPGPWIRLTPDIVAVFYVAVLQKVPSQEALSLLGGVFSTITVFKIRTVTTEVTIGSHHGSGISLSYRKLLPVLTTFWRSSPLYTITIQTKSSIATE